MYIDDFAWLPQVVEKLEQKHQVTCREVEGIFFNRPLVRFHEKGRTEGEHMYTALGQSDTGRYLVVFFIRKLDNRALIVSARDMSEAERKRYGRER